MTVGPAVTANTNFPIDDSNADIDGVLAAIDERLNDLQELGSLERQCPLAERCRVEEISALERAIEEVMSGSVSVQSVQWIRVSLEEKIGVEGAAAWFPEAGSCIRPMTFGGALVEQERKAARSERQQAGLPANPEVREVQRIFGDRIAGVVIRSYDASTDALSSEDRSLFHAFVRRSGMELAPITSELDVERLIDGDAEATGAAKVAEVHPPMTEVVHGLLAQGIDEMYHATGLFTYEALKGFWITGTERIGRNHGQFGGFFMAASLEWEDSNQGLVNYIQDDRFHEMSEEAAVPLSDRAAELASRGVLLKIDLRGYLEFLNSQSAPALALAGEVLRAACPPPPEFVRPIAVFEYPESK